MPIKPFKSIFIIRPIKLKKRKKQRKIIIFVLLTSLKSVFFIKIKENMAKEKDKTSNILNPKI